MQHIHFIHKLPHFQVKPRVAIGIAQNEAQKVAKYFFFIIDAQDFKFLTCSDFRKSEATQYFTSAWSR